ncbi:MAG: AAA family ATPase [Coriobacteriia bacterium]
MKLRSIEAVRYGGLRDASLDGLGDGLTVVHGPNEAGKSSFTALVRHVMYGFPKPRDKEPGHFVEGDGRLGRLVFEDGAGRWVIERAEGPRGGDVRVRAIEGPERPGLRTEVTHGVSALAFRVVFGFGLEEMARIEELRGSEDDIISKLYAASAGLAVSPHEIRSAIDREAGEIFKQGARKRELNTIASGLRTTRAAIREIKTAAETFQSDQRRSRELEGGLEALRESRDAARSHAVELARAADRASALRRVLGEQEEVLRGLRLQRKQLEDEHAAIVVDEQLLGRGPELDALLEEAGGFQAGCESLVSAQTALARAQARAADAATRTHLPQEAIAAIGADHGLSAAIDEAREELQRFQVQAEAREEDERRARATADRSAEVLARALEPLGIPAEGVADAVAERLAAIDALETLRGMGPRPAHRSADIPALIMLVSGLAAVATGIVLQEWVSFGIGVLLAGAGTVFLLRARSGAPVLPVTGERPFLDALGLSAEAGALEVSRMRRSLDAAKAAAAAARADRSRAEEAGTDAGLARESLQARKTTWRAWLAQRGLPADATPASAAQIATLAREACSAAGAVEEAQAEVDRIEVRLDEFATRLRAGVAAFPDMPQTGDRTGVPALVNRVRERLASARAASARMEQTARDLQGLDARIADEAGRAEAAADELRELLDRLGLAEGGDLAMLAERAEAAAREAGDQFETLAGEKNRLEGRLAGEAHERRSGELHLDEAGSVERLHEALDRLLVLSAASRLLSDALDRYERERQPEVVRSAEQLFSRITGGRYTGLSVPLTDRRMEVFDARAGARTSDILSTGAAQQLYLALRLGLIRNLGDAGASLPVLMDDVFANFDPDRKRGAAEAVAEMAGGRQVVFFTCHPEVAELFAEVSPGHTRIDLPRCG